MRYCMIIKALFNNAPVQWMALCSITRIIIISMKLLLHSPRSTHFGVVGNRQKDIPCIENRSCTFKCPME